jgi:hypothetical protein
MDAEVAGGRNQLEEDVGDRERVAAAAPPASRVPASSAGTTRIAARRGGVAVVSPVRNHAPVASCQRGGQKFVVSEAKATIATLEGSQRPQKVELAKLWPAHVGEVELAAGALPEQEA